MKYHVFFKLKDALYLIWKAWFGKNWFLLSMVPSNTFKAFYFGSKLPYLCSAYVMVLHLNCTPLHSKWVTSFYQILFWPTVFVALLFNILNCFSQLVMHTTLHLKSISTLASLIAVGVLTLIKFWTFFVPYSLIRYPTLIRFWMFHTFFLAIL